MAKPPRDVVKAAQNRFRETHAKAFENWAEAQKRSVQGSEFATDSSAALQCFMSAPG